MPKAFISYSHRDEKALGRLHTHLATLRRSGQISAWYDREIFAGDDLDQTIKANLDHSELFLALISPDFLNSNYCYEREMKLALERHEAGSLRLVPIILEPCDWQTTPLGKLKALPKDGTPISTWTNENVAYLDVVTELRRIIEAGESKDLNQPDRMELVAPKREIRKYRVKKDFDAIDRDEFQQKSFIKIKDFFRSSINELNEIGDPIRARFEQMSDLAFSCTVLNRSNRNSEAHITVRADTERSFGGDISYSFSRRAQNNTANGFIQVEASEYELYLKLSSFSFHKSDDVILSAEEAADALWREFISHAGIDHG